MEAGSSCKWAEIKQQITSIDWSQYETAYGNAAKDMPYDVPYGDSCGSMPKVEQALLDLFADERETALKASHDLWCELCHQHAYLSSAALPAFDFLFYALEHLGVELQVELLDIFYGFAVCSSNHDATGSWRGQLQAKLMERKMYFQRLAGCPEEELAAFAGLIVEALDS